MMIVHTHRMTPDKRNPLGPTGETVRENIKRFREGRNLGYIKLARMLDEIGRPIPELGLRRIEAGDRRVDVDDLMALAAVLGVSPISLLLPEMPGADRANDTVAAPGEDVAAGRLWMWLKADEPLPSYTRPRRGFWVDSRPEWDPGPGDPRLWSTEASDGDD